MNRGKMIKVRKMLFRSIKKKSQSFDHFSLLISRATLDRATAVNPTAAPSKLPPPPQFVQRCIVRSNVVRNFEKWRFNHYFF
jgi:hypothetical protein